MIVMQDGTKVMRMERAMDGFWIALISKSTKSTTERHVPRQFWVHEFGDVEHPIDGPFNDLESAFRAFKKHSR